MRFDKLLVSVATLGLLASMASAEPMRTVFTKENRLPEQFGGEVSIQGSYSGYDDEDSDLDGSLWEVGPALRFGIFDRLAFTAYVPFNGWDYSKNDDEGGLGDIHTGLQFLFFEDIFDYVWILPYVDVSWATGDEDKNLGSGETGGQFGIAVGTTTYDVLHWALDLSYGINEAIDYSDDDVVMGALSIIWDLNEMPRVYGGVMSSLFAEVQVRNDPIDPDDDCWVRGHGGLAFRANDYFTISGFVGATSDDAMDYYAGGKATVSF